MSFLKTVIKELDNEFAAVADEGVSSGDCDSFVDTGSYIFNALLSGSVFGGLPANKITALAGESSTGKTFFALSIVRYFLDQNPNGEVIYFESESAVTRKMMRDRKIDTSRVGIVPVCTVQEFRTQAIKVVDEYMKVKSTDRPPLLFVLDSLGMLSTTKELEDSAAGKETRDMTRAQVVKSIFRILTLKLGVAKIPLIVTNHTYDVVGCALEGTKVKTPTGNIDISNIKVGDYVNTMVGVREVTNTYEYEFDEYYKIELENGYTYNLTGEHKLMTQDGEWKQVSELTEEDIIINIGV
jgi:RecA/RadA recombinase